MAYTLLQLRTLARQRADMENSQLVLDPELTNYVNDSYAELYDLLVTQFEDYYLAAPQTFTIASGSNTQALPATFYKLRAIDLQNGSDWLTVRQFNFAERNHRATSISRIGYAAKNVSYRVMGQNIYFEPELDAAGTYRLWFIPRYTPLVADGDTMGDVLDFGEYVIIDAAIKMLIKEESDIGALMAQKQAMTERVMTMAKDRTVDQPERIADVSMDAYSFEGLFRRN